MLLVVIGEQKSDLCGKFKLELVKIAHLGFVVKVSQKCCERNTSKKLPKQIQFSPKAQIKCLSVCLAQNLKSQLILLFSLFLLLFMSPIALFGTIHGSHCTILANFYLYLQYFQQNVFNFNKINESQKDLNLFSNEHLVPFLFFVVIFKKMFWIHYTK